MVEHDSITIKLFEKSQIVTERELGSGSFGKVYKGTILENKLPVAVKIFRKELRNGEISQLEKEKVTTSAYEELLKLAVLDHVNIVKLYGMVQDGDSELPWLVFEYMKDGNLLEYVLRRKDNIKEKILIRFCKDICCGMAFLHENKILHKDLAARNILLNEKTAKISDLGLSTFLRNDDGDIYALNGKLFPYRHAAIECIVEQVYTFESDVWSFGILMFEIFSGGQLPYGTENKQPEVRRLIVGGITPLHLYEPNCSTKILLLAKKILNPNIRERPTFPSLYKKFQKLLNGSVMGLEFRSNENLHPNKDTTAALSAFHKIKANGLSASINNLQISESDGPNNHALISSTNNACQSATMNQVETLPISESISSRSSSTPDIVSAIGASANAMQTLASNFLIVKTQENSTGKRHSADNEKPLRQRRSSDVRQVPLSFSQQNGSPRAIVGEYFEEQRRRTNSGSGVMNNPLLEGFVKNRFRKS